MSTSAVHDSPDIVVHLGTAGEDASVHEGADRRRSGRRARARDRLMDRASQPYPPNAALSGVTDLETMLLFVDDDLRETALALARIEAYLVRTLGALEEPRLRRGEVSAIARDPEVLEQVDHMSETLESLRRRLAKLAARMR